MQIKQRLYGLKQAPRTWNANLHDYLLKLNYLQCKADPCVYVKRQANDLIFIAVYVDDLIIASNNINARIQLQQQLSKKYKMKDLGELHWCLGMRITRNRKERKITVDKSHYINTILQTYKMIDCNSAATPAQVGRKLSKVISIITF